MLELGWLYFAALMLLKSTQRNMHKCIYERMMEAGQIVNRVPAPVPVPVDISLFCST